MCGNFQEGNYIQPLWQEIKPAEDTDSSCEVYNGAVEAITALVGAILALSLGFTKVLIFASFLLQLSSNFTLLSLIGQ